MAVWSQKEVSLRDVCSPLLISVASLLQATGSRLHYRHQHKTPKCIEWVVIYSRCQDLTRKKDAWNKKHSISGSGASILIHHKQTVSTSPSQVQQCYRSAVLNHWSTFKSTIQCRQLKLLGRHRPKSFTCQSKFFVCPSIHAGNECRHR